MQTYIKSNLQAQPKHKFWLPQLLFLLLYKVVPLYTQDSSLTQKPQKAHMTYQHSWAQTRYCCWLLLGHRSLANFSLCALCCAANESPACRFWGPGWGGWWPGTGGPGVPGCDQWEQRAEQWPHRGPARHPVPPGPSQIHTMSEPGFLSGWLPQDSGTGEGVICLWVMEVMCVLGGGGGGGVVHGWSWGKWGELSLWFSLFMYVSLGGGGGGGGCMCVYKGVLFGGGGVHMYMCMHAFACVYCKCAHSQFCRCVMWVWCMCQG